MIIAETGADMSQFPAPRHLASWYTRHDRERAKRRAISQLRDLGYDITLNLAGAA